MRRLVRGLKPGGAPIGRREALGRLGAFGAAIAVGWGGEQRPAAMDASALRCIVHPELTEGFSRPGDSALEFTSQLFMDDAISDVVLARQPYNTRGQRRVKNANDRIYAKGGSRLMLDLRPANGRAGYVGSFNISLRTS